MLKLRATIILNDEFERNIFNHNQAIYHTLGGLIGAHNLIYNLIAKP